MRSLTQQWTTARTRLAPMRRDLRAGLIGAVVGVGALLYFGQGIGFTLAEVGMRIATAGGAPTLVTEGDIDAAVAESFAKLTDAREGREAMILERTILLAFALCLGGILLDSRVSQLAVPGRRRAGLAPARGWSAGPPMTPLFDLGIVNPPYTDAASARFAGVPDPMAEHCVLIDLEQRGGLGESTLTIDGAAYDPTAGEWVPAA